METLDLSLQRRVCLGASVVINITFTPLPVITLEGRGTFLPLYSPAWFPFLIGRQLYGRTCAVIYKPKPVKHFAKCLNTRSRLCVDGVPFMTPTGLLHAGSRPNVGSIWPPPPILGWTAPAAGSQGVPSEGGGLGLCHYDYCLSFL